jgi:hypothetical protein
MMCHGVTIALVPWLLDSSELIYGRRSRPLPGQDRRGEPVRPPMRRPLQPASVISVKDDGQAAPPSDAAAKHPRAKSTRSARTKR